MADRSGGYGRCIPSGVHAVTQTVNSAKTWSGEMEMAGVEEEAFNNEAKKREDSGMTYYRSY